MPDAHSASTHISASGIPSPVPSIEHALILFVDNDTGDFLRYRLTLACKLRDLGFDVHAALPQREGVENILRQGIPAHIFYLQRKSARVLDELRSLI